MTIPVFTGWSADMLCFHRTALAHAVSCVLSTGMVLPAYAKQTLSSPVRVEAMVSEIEVIQIRGIRASLLQASAMKRDADGILEAISAEDVGKFPDTNLAESLQRISGVAISRNNGEGAEVTVRGFGGDHNMVTLNGRQLPAASSYGGGSGADGTTRSGASRAFDFANLAAESISAVEVYKTATANIAAGGLGSTVNIRTLQPLNFDGRQAGVTVKAVHDSTNRRGAPLTPEISGLFSDRNAAGNFGWSLTASQQRRDSAYTGATVNDWQVDYWDDQADPDRLWNNSSAEVINAPVQGQLYSRPNDLRYAASDTSRLRDNYQLTLQFKPVAKLKLSADYLYAGNQITEQRYEVTNWMQTGSSTRSISFDNNSVKTPLSVREVYNGAVDEGYEQQWRQQQNTLRSVGLNIAWQVTAQFSLTLDAHDSTLFSRGNGPRNSGELSVALGAPVVTERQWFWDQDLPRYRNSYDDGVPGKATDGNGVINAADVGSSVARIRNASQHSGVRQVRLDGLWVAGDGQLEFGLEDRRVISRTMATAGNNITLGNWNVSHPGEFGDLIQPFDIAGAFSDYAPFSGGYGFIADARELYAAALQLYPGIPAGAQTLLGTDDAVAEHNKAAFLQYSVDSQLGPWPLTFTAGLRFEQTKSASASLTSAHYFRWEDNNDLFAYVDPTLPQFVQSEHNRYQLWLPNMVVSLQLSDELQSRIAISQTAGRAALAELGVAASHFVSGGGSTLLGASAAARKPNPHLLPLRADNIDLTLEWYYHSDSFLSVGYFQKNVMNFVGSRQQDLPLLGIRDVTAGPRAQAALSALREGGWPLDDTFLYAMMVFRQFRQHPDLLAQFGADPEFNGSGAQIDFLASHPGFDLLANPDDPLLIFRTTTPDNNKTARLHGAELAWQHFFTNSGFGIQANYTWVRGNVQFDRNADPRQSQFALPGLSDTANLIGIYQHEAWQARLAWNWRASYLAELNKGAANNPRFEQSYWQLDAQLSYQASAQLTLFVEGVNLTGQNSRSHARNKAMLWYLTDLGARYHVGLRYRF